MAEAANKYEEENNERIHRNKEKMQMIISNLPVGPEEKKKAVVKKEAGEASGSSRRRGKKQSNEWWQNEIGRRELPSRKREKPKLPYSQLLAVDEGSDEEEEEEEGDEDEYSAGGSDESDVSEEGSDASGEEEEGGGKGRRRRRRKAKLESSDPATQKAIIASLKEEDKRKKGEERKRRGENKEEERVLNRAIAKSLDDAPSNEEMAALFAIFTPHSRLTARDLKRLVRKYKDSLDVSLFNDEALENMMVVAGEDPDEEEGITRQQFTKLINRECPNLFKGKSSS